MSHELAHVRRYDCLFQILTLVMRSLYWFNPLAWWALRQVRLEQEQACDDYVLNQGVNPADYATDLLSVTANLADFQWDSAVALAMNRPNARWSAAWNRSSIKIEIVSRLRNGELCWHWSRSWASSWELPEPGVGRRRGRCDRRAAIVGSIGSAEEQKDGGE